MTFAISAVPLLVGVAGAIDLAALQKAKSSLRDAAETAAVASARATNASDDLRRERAHAALNENFVPSRHVSGDVTMNVDLTPVRSTVSAETIMETRIFKIFGKERMSVEVEVAAETMVETACVLVNSPNRSAAVKYQGHPTMDTQNCYVHANSSNESSALARGNPQLREAEFCLNGGFNGSRWSPAPETECGVRQDPYFDIVEPDLPPCDFGKVNMRSRGPITLQPGHYCRGLDFPANADIRLIPGTYYVSGGALAMKANANITGDGVMFYLAGDNSNFELHSGGNWNVTPQTSGDYKGIMILQDRNANPRRGNEITGGGTLEMTGALYAINNDLKLQGSPHVVMRGAGTMVLVDTLTLQGSPEFVVINTDDPNLRPNDRIIGREAYIRVVK